MNLLLGGELIDYTVGDGPAMNLPVLAEHGGAGPTVLPSGDPDFVQGDALPFRMSDGRPYGTLPLSVVTAGEPRFNGDVAGPEDRFHGGPFDPVNYAATYAQPMGFGALPATVEVRPLFAVDRATPGASPSPVLPSWAPWAVIVAAAVALLA